MLYTGLLVELGLTIEYAVGIFKDKLFNYAATIRGSFYVEYKRGNMFKNFYFFENSIDFFLLHSSALNCNPRIKI